MLARIDYVARIVHSSFMRQVIGAQEAVDRLRDAASARTTRTPLRPLLGRRIALVSGVGTARLPALRLEALRRAAVIAAESKGNQKCACSRCPKRRSRCARSVAGHCTPVSHRGVPMLAAVLC